MSIKITNLGKLQFTCVNAVSMIVVVTSSRFENSDQECLWAACIFFYFNCVPSESVGICNFCYKIREGVEKFLRVLRF